MTDRQPTTPTQTHEEPEPMTPERARYILAHTLLGGDFRHSFRQPGDSPNRRLDPDGITPAEHAAIMAHWRTLPGWTSYHTAVCQIARGVAAAE